jgi:hypothetical protein
VYASESSAGFFECAFVDNTAGMFRIMLASMRTDNDSGADFGGAVWISNGSPSFSSCGFTTNTASAFCSDAHSDGSVLTAEQNLVVLSGSATAPQAFRAAALRATLRVRSTVVSTLMQVC